VLVAIEQVSVAPPLAPEPLFVAHCVVAAYAPLFTDTSQVHEYVGVPVEGRVDCTVSIWFTSSIVALTVGVVGAVSALFTVTVDDAPDVCVSGVLALSVTRNSKL
jgi:hypothetical protein